MRHGWVYIYIFPPAASRFDELIGHLELRGMSLAYPPTGRVIMVSSTGEQVITTKEELRIRFSDCSEVAFNFYLNPSTSVFCSFDKLSEAAWREGYSLDGKSEQESQVVIDTLADLFRDRAQRGAAFAFVADRHAELYQDFHWDDFILGDAASPPEWPMILGLTKDFSKLSTIPRHMFDLEQTGQYLLFRRR